MLIPDTTKEFIFDTALSLFAQAGYDAVSIRDIANGVGIKGASIYNHYDSKKEIIDHIYEYFRENMLLGRIPQNEMMALVEKGNMEEVVDALNSVRYSNLDEKVGRRLISITKIIYSRMFSGDQAAVELYQWFTAEGVSTVKEALDYGVSVGRFREFDTEGFAHTFVALHADMAVSEFLKPEFEPVASSKESKVSALMCTALRLVERMESTEASRR